MSDPQTIFVGTRKEMPDNLFLIFGNIFSTALTEVVFFELDLM